MQELEFLAAVCSGLFAGAALYISLVQQPAARQVGDAAAAAFFPPMYRRAAPWQVGLALVGTVSALLAWLSGSGPAWLIGALLLGSVIPFTLLRIKPVTERLLAPGLDPEAPELSHLLDRWGALHAVRSAAGAASFLLFLAG